MEGLESDSEQFVDTPRGIFAANGLWFRTTVDLLKEFAGEVLEKESINSLIEKSLVIYQSPKSVGLWSLLAGLLISPPWIAVAISLLAFLGWSIVRRSIGGDLACKFLRLLDNVGFQALGFTAGLSWLAFWPDMAKVAVGLIGFICYRWNVIDSIMKPLLKKSSAGLGVADQILRSVIVRSAIKHQVSLDFISSMESRLAKSMGIKK